MFINKNFMKTMKFLLTNKILETMMVSI